MNEHIFSIVPAEVWLDKRLTLEQLRVLLALFSFRDVSTNTVWPNFDELSASLHESLDWIDARIRELTEIGWIGVSNGQQKVLCPEVIQ